MDSIVKSGTKGLSTTAKRPTRHQAQQAVKTLIAWAGDDPDREGLIDTPDRVVDAFGEWFSGYDEDPAEYLACTFDDTQGYDDMVMLRNVAVVSHCEHHLAPFIGTACVAYIPVHSVVGLSKLARVVNVFARRLQTQEILTTQICQAIQTILKPAGTAVMIDAIHQCMTTRGVNHPDVATVTTRFSGIFKNQTELRERFLHLCRK